MYIIIYDFGTSNVKAGLFEIASEIKLVAGASASYGLYITANGGAEQDTEEWWSALCATTRELFQKSDVKPGDIQGMAFCSQMQGAVFVDESGRALRRPMNYLDQRGVREYKDCMGKGLIKVSGCDVFKLARNLAVNYAASVSAKDPVWKYKWVENNEPEVFRRMYKWLDVGDYLTARCTGRIIRTADTAFATFLYDTRKGKEGWNKGLLKMYGVRPEHMPEIIDCTDFVGGLTEKAAEELGLPEGIPVFGGGGDVTFVNIGAGSTRPGDTHIYVGTSGWVSTCLDHQTADISAMITGTLSARHGYFNYYAELETAGKCFEWVMNHLALDEIGVYLNQTKVTDVENKYHSLYNYLSAEISKVPPGANGVIFTPWLHGNRCPFEDSRAGGNVFQYPRRKRQERHDPRRAGGDLLSPALAAGMRGEEGKNLRPDPLCRRRRALARYLPDAGRYYRPDDRDDRQHPVGGRDRRRAYRRGGHPGRGRDGAFASACKAKPRLHSRSAE